MGEPSAHLDTLQHDGEFDKIGKGLASRVDEIISALLPFEGKVGIML